MSSENLAITDDLVEALTDGDGPKAAALIAPTLKSNFSRSGITTQIGAGNIDEIIARAGHANVQVLEKFSDGERFAGRYSYTVKGEDVPGGEAGKTAEVTGLVFGRVAGGKVVEVYHEQDTVGMLLALGLPVGV